MGEGKWINKPERRLGEISADTVKHIKLLEIAVRQDSLFEYSQPRLFNMLSENAELLMVFINEAELVFKSVLGVSPLIWDEYPSSLDLKSIRLPDIGDCLNVDSYEKVAQAGYLLCLEVKRDIKSNRLVNSGAAALLQLALCWSLLRQIIDQISDQIGVELSDHQIRIKEENLSNINTNNGAGSTSPKERSAYIGYLYEKYLRIRPCHTTFNEFVTIWPREPGGLWSLVSPLKGNWKDKGILVYTDDKSWYDESAEKLHLDFKIVEGNKCCKKSLSTKNGVGIHKKPYMPAIRKKMSDLGLL